MALVTWVGVQFGSDFHVIPEADLIDHEETACVCGPEDHFEPPDVWLTVHHSLDGREVAK